MHRPGARFSDGWPSLPAHLLIEFCNIATLTST